ncbi:MAG: CPXCG motif-containing cysteine-rich protein [Pseudomonadota bacterium]
MSGLLAECTASCPFCGEVIDLFVDTSAGDQQYIEDCFVCCRPIQISVTVDGDEVMSLHAEQSH